MDSTSFQSSPCAVGTLSRLKQVYWKLISIQFNNKNWPMPKPFYSVLCCSKHKALWLIDYLGSWLKDEGNERASIISGRSKEFYFPDVSTDRLIQNMQSLPDQIACYEHLFNCVERNIFQKLTAWLPASIFILFSMLFPIIFWYQFKFWIHFRRWSFYSSPLHTTLHLSFVVWPKRCGSFKKSVL